MNITKDLVLEALRHVDDPDLKKDLVTLNMIQDVIIDKNKVGFKLVLTTPACPMKNLMKSDCEKAIHKYIGKEVEVDVELTSNVTTRRKELEEMLPGVKNIIAISSGKGGVGKSTIAANLAIALAQTGAKVGLVDGDIYGPSMPIMFNLIGERPYVKEENGQTKVIPIEKYGIKLLSIGFFIDPDKALVWRGPMASNAMKQLFSDGDWGELDYMVIDLPPGTGDIHLTLVQSLPVTGAIVVTTPQQVAIADVRKVADMFLQDAIKVPLLGVVENMSYFSPAELPDNKYFIFGKDGGKKLAESLKTPLLGQIPLVQSVSESGDQGKPIVLDDKSPVAKAFKELAQNIAQQIAIRNAFLAPTKIVEMNK
ncbi:Mrp/NBP35 family ATP-binding protein [Bacteroidota bacterium]